MGMKVTASFSGPGSAILRGKPISRDAIRKGVFESLLSESKEILRKTKDATPVKSGKAKSGWTMTTMTSGGLVQMKITNNVRYIGVLEYGGYPVRAVSRASQRKGAIRRGRAYLGGDFLPGPDTVGAPGGEPKMLQPGLVSRQAPRGMLRKAVKSSEKKAAQKVESALSSAIAKAFGKR